MLNESVVSLYVSKTVYKIHLHMVETLSVRGRRNKCNPTQGTTNSIHCILYAIRNLLQAREFHGAQKPVSGKYTRCALSRRIDNTNKNCTRVDEGVTRDFGTALSGRMTGRMTNLTPCTAFNVDEIVMRGMHPDNRCLSNTCTAMAPEALEMM